MADYHSPTIIQQTIPRADITPLEHLLLTHIFDAEPHGDGWYFFAEERPADMIAVSRAELDAALAKSQESESTASTTVAEQLAHASSKQNIIDLDLSGTSWAFILQDIVRRSASLRYVTAITSFTCSKMRPDGFAGMAVLITAEAIKSMSTYEIVAEFIAAAGLGG